MAPLHGDGGWDIFVKLSLRFSVQEGAMSKESFAGDAARPLVSYDIGNAFP